MALWGNKDAKSSFGGSVAVNGSTGAVTGTGTKLDTNFAVGDFLYVGDNNYVFTAITSNTAATVINAGGAGSTLKGASANSSYVVSEKPLYLKYSMNIDANNVYGVSTSEMDYANTGSTESDNIAHAGWVQRTVGSGGRAGRVFYETLVAGSSITGDAGDDSTLPE